MGQRLGLSCKKKVEAGWCPGSKEIRLMKPERSLVIFPFFKQCNPLKINLQNFEIDKKK